jgi:hypothetical protein
MTDAPNCWKCRFFKISWDPKFPYECEAMNFKSQALPCTQVLSIDARHCQWFHPKADETAAGDIETKSGVKGTEIDRSV